MAAPLDLFTLTWTRLNAQRLVTYFSDAGGRRVDYVTEALDPDVPVKVVSSTTNPDSWPYAEGALVATQDEGSIRVKLYALRTPPYARFETSVIGPNPGVVCDLQVLNPVVSGSSLSFQVSTSNGPWRTALDVDEELAYSQGRSGFEGLTLGAHVVYVRDAGGCATSYSFVTGQDSGGNDAEGLPAGSILLRVRDKLMTDADAGGDYYQHYASYYLPSTRATFERRLSDSLQAEAYSLATTQIIDRWCLEPGVAPYAEIQVTHDGFGGVTFTREEGAAACQVLCTVYLSETHQSAEGYGEIVAVAHASDAGGGQFSLDNFATTGVEATAAGDTWTTTFADLPAGRYTLRYRENRAGGCRASLVVDLANTYGPRWRHAYPNRRGQACRLDLLKLDYTGPMELVDADATPIIIDKPGSATGHVFGTLLQGSECAISLLQTHDEQYLEVFSGSDRLFRADHYTDGVLDWRGFVPPEQYDVAFVPGKKFFALRATDGLGALSEVPFVRPTGAAVVGDLSLLEILLLCLGKLSLELPLRVLGSLYPTGADRTRSWLEAVQVDAGQYASDSGEPWDCGQVLSKIATTFQLRLYQEAGAWWLERLRDLSAGELTYFCYSPTGAPLPLFTRTLLREVRQDSALRWLTAAQRQQARGAVARVTATQAVGKLVNLLDRFLPAAEALALPDWGGVAPYELPYAGRGKTPILRLPGATPGQPLSQVAYLQTPDSSPILLRAPGQPAAAVFALSFTVQPYGNVIVSALTGTKGEWNESTPYHIGDRVIYGFSYYQARRDNQGQNPGNSPDDWFESGTVSGYEAAQTAQLFVALRHGERWLRPYDTTDYATAEEAAWPIPLPDDKPVRVALGAYLAYDTLSHPVSVRLYQPLAGGASAPVTVDITELTLTYQNLSPQLAEGFAERYNYETKVRAARQDVDNDLFHLDTPYARRQGTLLQASGLPTSTWQETPAGEEREVGVFFVRDRAGFQLAPAQVLTGTLGGSLGPGALLTDPAEARPGLYLLPSWRRDVKADEYTITAVQLINLGTLLPGADTLPDGAIYNENLTAWTTESGAIILYENAG